MSADEKERSAAEEMELLSVRIPKKDLARIDAHCDRLTRTRGSRVTRASGTRELLHFALVAAGVEAA